MKLFYDHIIEIHIGDIIVKLEEFDISLEERKHLVSILDSILHHRIMGLILEELHPERHEIFLVNLNATPHNRGILDFLVSEVGNMEKKIDDEARKIKDEVLYEVLV